jgi:probable rRNA maturation factor
VAVFLSDEQRDHEVDGADLVALARFVLAERSVPADMELSILLVDADTIRSMNRVHMGKDAPTDVLAFPIDEPGESPPGAPSVLGDVVLCPVVADMQATTYGRTRHQELQMLTVHGILHLLGLDHANAAEERHMFGLTDELLRAYRHVAERR